jgi:hypothetical protein
MRKIFFVDDKKQTTDYNEGPFCDSVIKANTTLPRYTLTTTVKQ